MPTDEQHDGDGCNRPVTARDEALEAMRHTFHQTWPCRCHSAYKTQNRTDPRCTYHRHVDDLTAAFDAIPASVHAELAIDGGGMAQVDVWHDARCDRDCSPASCWHPINWVDVDGGPCRQLDYGDLVPVYRLIEETQNDAG